MIPSTMGQHHSQAEGLTLEILRVPPILLVVEDSLGAVAQDVEKLIAHKHQGPPQARAWYRMLRTLYYSRDISI
jgi:hypothetical protein